jgi:hypothetical protein
LSLIVGRLSFIVFCNFGWFCLVLI